jgi:UDP-hydrolysing UDP-N-acetyl-D-glucosamine 2-epimerase
MLKKRVCVVTGARAEYGLLKPLIEKLIAAPSLETGVFATGMHLSPEFGLTVGQIEADGLPVDERIEILLSSDTAIGVSKSMGLALIGFAEAIARRAPDLLVLLGDRFETFCAATAATVARVPVAHLHGGELTAGAMDDAFRHGITKMASLHFTSTEAYRRRVIQLGEAPESVHQVGALGVELAKSTRLLSRGDLETELGIRFGERNVLVTFHPATWETSSPDEQVAGLMAALGAHPDLHIIFTRANADMGGRAINGAIDRFLAAHPGRAWAFQALGLPRYLSVMKCCDAVVGNSSSGILEAPAMGVPTINIGTRQEGRVRAASVHDCPAGREPIAAMLEQMMQGRLSGASGDNPYDGGETSSRIRDLIVESLARGIGRKTFRDLERG